MERCQFNEQVQDSIVVLHTPRYGDRGLSEIGILAITFCQRLCIQIAGTASGKFKSACRVALHGVNTPRSAFWYRHRDMVYTRKSDKKGRPRIHADASAYMRLEMRTGIRSKVSLIRPARCRRHARGNLLPVSGSGRSHSSTRRLLLPENSRILK